MSADNTTQLVLALLGFALAAAAFGWSAYGRSVWPPVSALALAAAAVVAAVADDLSSGRVEMTVLVALAGTLAVVGGGPVTTRIFAIVDRRATEPAHEEQQTLDQAGEILRGGAWIGALERLAVFAGLAAGFPEGVAVVLALKGVGRFPDLRAEGRGGAATERFIIGTFTSVLWAAACAGMVALIRR
jgi:F0F1-type ATP synthase membrane subunit c/vacuolar-type H+-ATPase subunit K